MPAAAPKLDAVDEAVEEKLHIVNMLFAVGTEGAHRACIRLGIAATCRATSVLTIADHAWAFERLGTHRDPDSTPAQQAATRPVIQLARACTPASLIGHDTAHREEMLRAHSIQRTGRCLRPECFAEKRELARLGTR